MLAVDDHRTSADVDGGTGAQHVDVAQDGRRPIGSGDVDVEPEEADAIFECRGDVRIVVETDHPIDLADATDRMELSDGLRAESGESDHDRPGRGKHLGCETRGRAGANRREQGCVGDRNEMTGLGVPHRGGGDDRGQPSLDGVGRVVPDHLDHDRATGFVGRHPLDQTEVGLVVAESISRPNLHRVG